MAFSTLCLCIAAKVPLMDTALYLIQGLALCAFSTAWGCVCGIRHMRLDWENEIEVIKQGSAVSIYLLPNLFVVMGLIVLMVFLGMRLDHRLLALIMTAIAALLAALSYLRVMALARRPQAAARRRRRRASSARSARRLPERARRR
jgi:ABC-2 type transport system permease protein